MMIMLYYLLGINFFSFFLLLFDKFQAKKQKFRIQETLFFFFSMLGGGFGILLGMKAGHHKTQKQKFKMMIIISSLLWIVLLVSYLLLDYLSFVPKRSYTAKDFHIEVVKSAYDQNQNGIDDYTDILLGAKEEARRNPKYKSAYYDGGYAPLSEGVCTDLVIRSLLNAGYFLKDMIDEDIRNHVELYPRVEGKPDPNIDFRRVKNLKVFFDRTLEPHTLLLEEIDDWQPGDIVIFGKQYTHIGIISDKRNQKGIPYLIHNAGQPKKEEDTLERWEKRNTITGHYRFRLKGDENEKTRK